MNGTKRARTTREADSTRRVSAAAGLIVVVTVASGVLSLSPVQGQLPEGAYVVDDIATPFGVSPEPTAIAFHEDGELVAAFRHGQVFLRSIDGRGEWRRFADGLLWPLGVLPLSKEELLVLQMPELTRVVDTDGDGEADLYETVCDGWGLAGNYHEFVAGPVRGRDGDLFVALGCVSSGGPIRPPVRGQLREDTQLGKRYGHYSPVPWRGWVLRIAPSGEITPFASGFRQPNGLVLSPQGQLFSVDNQGDWVGTSPLHHVTRGAFHGHPASLVWDSKFDGDPGNPDAAALERLRKPPAILFPQNDLAGSIAQPVFDRTEGRFGPYRGQLFIAEWSHPRVLRASLEEVDGVWQGACFLFLEGRGLRPGGNRLAFSPDGNLWVAQVSRVWGGSGEGLQRISWRGETPLDILDLKLERNGFRVDFTATVDASTAARVEAWSLQRYRYLYHATYGSPKVDVRPLEVRAVTVGADERSAVLTVDGLQAGFVYELRPNGIRGRDGAELVTRLAAYTINRLRR